MNSSGMKRGLAATAISALAVTGLPFLATSASATPIEDTLADNAVAFYSQDVAGISDKNDGTNTTVSLVTGGGANVTSVLYQYESSTAVGTWVDVPGGLVARNADGVFAYDWAGVPDTVTRVRAVPNTGVANAVEAAAPTVLPDTAAETVELDSEGSLGVFQEPYTETTGAQELLAVTGTVSEGTGAVNVSDASHGTAGSDTTVVETTADTTSDTFNSVLNIEGYDYSAGAEANQIALNAATANTDDAEGSTLYVQQIGSITATPETQERSNPSNSEITLTVLDTTGQPVAGAQVGVADLDTDGAGPDTDGADTILGTTDGRGQIEDNGQTTAGTFTYYVNTTDDNEYEAGTDPADTATVTTYTPVITTVDVVNNNNRSNFDIDEFADSDDFTIATEDQRGNPIDENLTGADVQYRWVIDPAGTAPAVTSPWIDAETDADGEFPVPGPTDAQYATWSGTASDLPEGSYTIEARRPNVSGAGLINATPETVSASESEITYAEGASANAAVNGTFTVDGTLANDGGGLAGREVQLTYAQGVGNDAGFAPQSAQPAGVTVTPATGGVGSTAVAVTGADGSFSVALRDPQIPANVDPIEESGTLNAIAEESATDTTSLQGDLGPNDSTVANDPNNAEQNLVINWIELPDAASIDINVDELVFGQAGPGAPVDLDITVEDADGNDLSDYPVEVSVDKGFLSPNAETEGDLSLAEGHDDEGDLWGFFEQLGQSESISTGDAADAGIVAAMERDADFDDDGLSEMTITVKAGDVTETETVTFDVRVLLNQTESSLERAAGEPAGEVMTGDEVDFNLYVHDQFGNLAGDQFARITDDSTVADFRTDEDLDQTLSDFTTSGPGVTAFSDAPATQTLFAAMSPGEQIVDDSGDRESNSRNVSIASDPIVWVEGPTKLSPDLELTGKNNGGKADRLMANAKGVAAGAEVSLFKKTANGWKKIREGVLNAKGNKKFKVADKNGKKFTTYKAVVKPTVDTTKDVDKKKVR